MNKLIEELADKAITEKLTLDEFTLALQQEPHDFYGFRIKELEEFVRLIVEECVRNSGTRRYVLDHFGLWNE